LRHAARPYDGPISTRKGAARIKWVFGRIQTVIDLRKIDLRGTTSVG